MSFVFVASNIDTKDTKAKQVNKSTLFIYFSCLFNSLQCNYYMFSVKLGFNLKYLWLCLLKVS